MLLQTVHSHLTLPVLSELYRNRPEIAVAQYYRYRQPIDVVAFTVAGVLWVLGPTLVNVLYGSRYSDAGGILQILSIAMLAFPFGMIIDAFLANSQMRLFGLLSIINSVSFVIAVFVGFAVSGIPGVIWGLTLFRWPQIISATALAHKRGWIMPLREIAFLPMFGVGMLLGYAVERAIEWIPWRMMEIL